MNTYNYNKRIEVWCKNATKTENELHQTEYSPGKVKTIWCSITPQTGRLATMPAGTVLADTTTLIKCRYKASRDITEDMWLMYFDNEVDRNKYLQDQSSKFGHRYDINYILNPYFENSELQFFCTEKVR